jgi:hypothetical protein
MRQGTQIPQTPTWDGPELRGPNIWENLLSDDDSATCSLSQKSRKAPGAPRKSKANTEANKDLGMLTATLRKVFVDLKASYKDLKEDSAELGEELAAVKTLLTQFLETLKAVQEGQSAL